jgi:superfamily I DNA/RNA helicase
MLARGYKPSRVVVITFTTAAADEMKKRIGHIDGLFIGTIHAYAFYLLCASGLNEKALAYVNEDKFDKLFTLVKNIRIVLNPLTILLLMRRKIVQITNGNFLSY